LLSAIASGTLPLTGAATGVVVTTIISGVSAGDLPLGGSAAGAVRVIGLANGVLVITGAATAIGPVQFASRFAFPGDPANGGKLAVSRRGGRLVR